MLIGPDTAGNLLEVVVLITAEGTQIVIALARCEASSAMGTLPYYGQAAGMSGLPLVP